MIAKTPETLYYAVIFTSVKVTEHGGFEEMAEKMWNLALQQSGFLGAESARNEVGLTVSYWKDLDSIKNWKQNSAHLEAQDLGKSKWYERYKVRICKGERDYEL